MAKKPGAAETCEKTPLLADHRRRQQAQELDPGEGRDPRAAARCWWHKKAPVAAADGPRCGGGKPHKAAPESGGSRPRWDPVLAGLVGPTLMAAGVINFEF